MDGPQRILRTVAFVLTVGALLVVGGAVTRSAPAAVLGTPKVTGFTPASGVAGTRVRISGKSLVGVTAVSFNGVPGGVDVGTDDGPTQATVEVPAGATTGPISVTVGGQTVVSSKSFVIPSAVTSVKPKMAQTGSIVLIRGVGLSNTTGVVFGGASAEFSVQSSTLVAARVPDAAGQDDRWMHLVVDGVDVPVADPFFVIPTITSIAPESGAVGSTVTITGTGLAAHGRAWFGGVAAYRYFSFAPSTIVVAVPEWATTGPIQVSDEGGGTAFSADTFVVLPSIDEVYPTSGAAGTTVDVGGWNLAGATSVRLGSVEVPFTVLSPTHVRFEVPDGATSGQITVTTPDGTSAPSDTTFDVVGP